MNSTKKTLTGLLCSLLMLTGASGAATVTIDGAQTYQTIDGFGVNANAQSWNNNELQPVLDALIDQGGMTLFMANLASNSNWEDANDNSDPSVMNWTYYNSVYSAPNFQRLWGMMAYLNQRGIIDGLVPKFGGPAALWLGGLSLTPGYENEYAETLASALIYARNTQHLQFSVVWPVNEPDWHDSGVNMTGPAQYVAVMDDLGQQLDAHGMSDVRFSGPELAWTSTSWLAAMMDDPYLMSKMAYFGLHGYQGLSYDSTGVYDFIQQSAYPNSHFWMTEFGVWCSSCQSGGGGDDSWAYAQGTASVLINHLANGASAGVVYEGYDSQYLGYNSATGKSEPATWSYWGLFGVDDINAVTKTYTPRKQFYTVCQISKFVRPGAQRINVSGSTTPLTLLAFYQSASGQLTLTGVNTNSSAAALSGTLTSLPRVGSLELYYTDSTSNLRDSGAVPVNSGSFAATVPAKCVFTLVGYTSAAGAPVISQQPRSQAVLAAGTALFTATASGTSPLSYQWRFNGTNLANGSQVSGVTSPTLSILNAQPTNAGSYSVVVTNAAGSVTSTVAVLSVIVPGSCFPPPAGLVGWWPGDGNANDIAGTNNGILQGGATASAIGVAGSAFSFDGTNAFVQIPDAPALKPTNLTLEAWVMFSDLDSALSGTAPSGDQYIVFKQNPQTSSFEGYALEKFRLESANGDVFMFTVGSASGQEVFLPSATLISTGVWYHVAAVRGSNFMQLYVNGQLETQTNVSFAQDYGTKPLYFGTSGDTGWDGKLKGSLDEVSLYNRVLSASEVAALYAAGAAGKCKALSITTQPQNQSVAVGSNATFTVAAAGLAPLGYQWRFNGAAISRATNTSFTATNAQSSNAGSYSAVVTNSTSSVTSAVAVLTVTVPPAITSQPATQSVVAGTNISFSVTASGTPPLSYQWQFNGAAIGGATSTSLTLLNVQPANAGNYTVVVTNSAASVTSAVAVLTVLGPPAITVQPASQSVVTGANMSFSVTASGTPPLSYQWRFNGTNLANSGQVSGVTSATLSLTNVQPTNAGNYAVVVTNSAASVTSTVATLTVIVPGSCCSPPAGLVGWWPGDGNANDIAGTNNGALKGGATASAIGVVGSAFSFDGTNAFVQIPDAPVLKPTNLTLEAWVMFSGLDSALSGIAPSGDQYIVFKQNSRTSYFEGYALEKYRLANGDVFMFTVGSGSGEEVFLPSATLISTGIWYHVAAVRGSNFMQLYVNGQLETQTNVSFAQDYGTKPLYFGTSGDPGWDGKLKGRLDEVSLYNRALSASEVAAIYATGAAGKCKGLSITTQPQSQGVAVGSNATFTVAAAGTAPLSYQWRFNGATIAGATNTSLTLANAQPSNAGSYSAVVTNLTGSATSAVAVLTVMVPPTITAQPQSQTNNYGTTATFTVSATGTAPLNYQWKFNGTNLANATGSSYTVSSVQATNAGNYSVVVTNLAGSTTSSNAMLSVNVTPAITTQPQDKNVNQGSSAVFSVVATGTPALAYQWRKNSTPISGATASSYTVTNAQPADAGSYSVVVTNIAGTATSTNALLTVNVAPAIATHPQDQNVNQSSDAVFTVVATGTPAPSYQWRFNGTNLASATVSAYTCHNAQPANAGSYSVVVSNAAATLTSSDAILTVNVPPEITAQPQSVTVAPGSNVTLTVTATGTAPLSYQWRFNGTNLAYGTASAYICTNAQTKDAGSYSVVVSNIAGTVTSADALLTVTQPTPPRIDSIVLTSGGQIQLQVSGAPGHYAIEAASNLVDWAELTNFPSTNTTFQHLDPETNLIQRFYRTLLIP